MAVSLVTGNRLHDGAVVYYAGDHDWTRDINAARLVPEAEGEALLDEALAGPKPLAAVGPVVIGAEIEDGKVVPVTLRERIRLSGPTV